MKYVDLRSYEKKIYSQNGEDGVTAELIKLMYDNPVGDSNRCFAEFGAGDGKENCTRNLVEEFGWRGLMLDGKRDVDRGHFQVHKARMDKDNVVPIFKSFDIPSTIDFLSVDIDSNDFYCLQPLLDNYDVGILVTEVNLAHKADEDKVSKYDPNFRWDGSRYYGHSLLAVTKLCLKYGMVLVYLNRGALFPEEAIAYPKGATFKGTTNAYFVKMDLLAERRVTFANQGNVAAIWEKPDYGRGADDGHHPYDKHERDFISYDEALKILE